MEKFFAAVALSVLLASSSYGAGLLDEANEWYARRGNDFDITEMRVNPKYIDHAIDLYKCAYEKSSGKEKEEACWKYIRACYFKGQFVLTDRDSRKAVYDLGKKLGEDGLKLFSESVGINIWMSIIWGVWGEENGIIQSAREGVAGRIRDHCEKVIALDENFQDAAGHRILGRLHAKAPRIPLVLSWPSKEKAVEYLEIAHKIAPHNLNTKEYLAEALYNTGQRERATRLMRDILSAKESGNNIVEEAFVKRNALETLRMWER